MICVLDYQITTETVTINSPQDLCVDSNEIRWIVFNGKMLVGGFVLGCVLQLYYAILSILYPVPLPTNEWSPPSLSWNV